MFNFFSFFLLINKSFFLINNLWIEFYSIIQKAILIPFSDHWNESKNKRYLNKLGQKKICLWNTITAGFENYTHEKHTTLSRVFFCGMFFVCVWWNFLQCAHECKNQAIFCVNRTTFDDWSLDFMLFYEILRRDTLIEQNQIKKFLEMFWNSITNFIWTCLVCRKLHNYYNLFTILCKFFSFHLEFFFSR